MNDVRPGPAYSGGLFFYDHTAGTSTTWYRIRTVDGASQTSAWGNAFQAGTAMDPPSGFTSEALLESVKRRASLPVSQVTFQDTDLLEMADEEVLTSLVPLILSANEDYLLATQDITLDGSSAYRIPSRAIGAKLRSACFVTSSGEEVPVPRVQPERNPSLGFYIRAGYVVPVNTTGASYPTLRLRFYLRPAKLVPTDSVGVFSGVDLAAGTATLGLIPVGFETGGQYDIVKGVPPFDSLLLDKAVTFSGSTATFPAALPDGVEAGDLLCPAGQTNVVQLPAEWFHVLAQLVAAKCLEVLGDEKGYQAAALKAEQMKAAALGLISNRVEGNVEVVIPTHSPWRQ